VLEEASVLGLISFSSPGGKGAGPAAVLGEGPETDVEVARQAPNGDGKWTM